MSKPDTLPAQHPSAFERPAVTVDLVLMTVRERVLQVLLIQRDEEPFQGKWALPGTFVRIDETLDEAAQRVLREKAGLAPAFLEQLYTFGAVHRDPRMRIITVAYFALMPFSILASVENDERSLGTIRKGDGNVTVLDFSGNPVDLPFDHAEILTTAVERLRAKLDWSDVAFALLPDEFTLRELQEVHEVIRGRALNKPAFRKRMLDSGRLEPTGRREAGLAFRPAELYRLRRAA